MLEHTWPWVEQGKVFSTNSKDKISEIPFAGETAGIKSWWRWKEAPRLQFKIHATIGE
jgi:hypothetical protein